MTASRNHSLQWLTCGRLAVVVLLIGTSASPLLVARQQASTGVPSLSGPLIDAVRAYAVHEACGGDAPQACHVEADFLPLGHYVDGRARLTVTSARAGVAYTAWKAAASGTVYSTPAGLQDVVTVHCGTHEHGAIFECASVTILAANGTPVAPVSYESGASVSRNVSGVKWSVRQVDADYPVTPLRNGFSVTYTDFSGASSRFTVSAAQASRPLLLRIEDGTGAR